MKIIHFCSSHSRYDTRVFKKICRSLAKLHDVTYICAEGNNPPSEKIDNVYLIDIGRKKKTKVQRYITTPPKLFLRALKEKADIYHIHDPELIIWGLLLKLFKKKVIIDCHELYLDQILDRGYIRYIKYPVFFIWWLFERIAIPFFDSVICATDRIFNHFIKLNKSTYRIYNYPLLEEFEQNPFRTLNQNKRKGLIYLGGISSERGIRNIVKAMDYIDEDLHLVGPFVDENFRHELMKLDGWKKVIWHGPQDRINSINLLYQAKIGVINFLPKKNHTEALPNKIFEYLAAGLYVCASDFKYWRDFFQSAESIDFADPNNPEALAQTINSSLKKIDTSTSDKAKFFAQNHSWHSEEKKILEIYSKLEKTS